MRHCRYELTYAIYLARKWVMFLFVDGACICLTSWIFLGSGFIHYVVYIFQNKLKAFDLIMHLPKFNLKPAFLVLFIASCRCRSQVKSETNICTSSAISYSTSTDLISWSILLWKTSWDILKPKGILRNLYLPLCVKHCHGCDSLASGTVQ